MMSNEFILLLLTFVDICFIFTASRLGTKWLFGAISINFILISIFGSILGSIFGFVTNISNVFYACIFLATHFLFERDGAVTKFQVIRFGIRTIVFFAVLSQLTLLFTSTEQTAPFLTAAKTLFSLSPRIALASILGYLFAQQVNISLFTKIKSLTKGKHLWLRSNGANIIAQFVDSALFFTIAFPTMPGVILVQSILVGWLIKVCVVALGTPFLYLDTRFKYNH